MNPKNTKKETSLQRKSLLLDMKELIDQQGWASPTPIRHFAELAIHCSLFLLGAGMYFSSTIALGSVFGLLISTLGSFGIATNTHTASHSAALGNRQWNLILSLLGYSFVHGLSATYWHHKHVSLHHRAPNVDGIDPDMDPEPYFSLKVYPGQSPTLRQRIQWLYVPLLLPFMSLGMVVNGLKFLISANVRKSRFRTIHALDLMLITLHFSLWMDLANIFGVQSVALFMLGRLLLLSLLFFAAFAPAHLSSKVSFLDSHSIATHDRLQLVLLTTVNFRAPWPFSFFLSGLEYQIEHHLFPTTCHRHYPEMARALQRLCKEYGVSYHTVTWAEGYADALKTFIVPKVVSSRVLRH